MLRSYVWSAIGMFIEAPAARWPASEWTAAALDGQDARTMESGKDMW